MTTPSPEDSLEDRSQEDAEDPAAERAGDKAGDTCDGFSMRHRNLVAGSFEGKIGRLMAAANVAQNEPFSKRLGLPFAEISTPMSVAKRLGLREIYSPASMVQGLGEVANLTTLSKPISSRMEGLMGQVGAANRPMYAKFTALATSQVAARDHMTKILDQSLPNAALGVSIAQAARPSMRLLEAYDGWLSSYQPKTWTEEAFAPVAYRGFTVDGLIVTDSLTTLTRDAAAYADLAEVVEAEVLPPWQEARLDLTVRLEARLAAIDPKMAEFYRAACAAVRREGQDGFLEEACTGLYELLVRLFRQHIATDEKMEEYELANSSAPLRNAQGKYTHAARVRFAILGHRRGSDRDLFAATADGLAKAHEALVGKASKGRHDSVGSAMTLRTLLMATESTLSQVLDLYETQSNPRQD